MAFYAMRAAHWGTCKDLQPTMSAKGEHTCFSNSSDYTVRGGSINPKTLKPCNATQYNDVAT